MTRAATAPRAPGQPPARGAWVRLWLWFIGLTLAAGAMAQALDKPVEIQSLAVSRATDAIYVEYQLRIALPRSVEEAALRGVPLYFRAEVELYRPRWYWRDDRVARAVREWRLSYQPLTSTWRVSQAGLGQTHATLAEALAAMTQASQWRVADAGLADADGRHYAEFSWRLDTGQLPRPLQIGLNNPVTGVGADWTLGVERSVKLTSQ
jgi:Domain of unknown function (DUF4390)